MTATAKPSDQAGRARTSTPLSVEAQRLEHLVGRLVRLPGGVASEVFGAVRHPEKAAERARKVALGVTLASAAARTSVLPLLRGQVEDWRDEDAYSLAVQALVYGFPYIYNAKLRHDWVTQPRDPAHTPYAAVNHFWHAIAPVDATYRDGGCPNNDTLYSIAWVDLSAEPVILSHPDMGQRYFAFQLAAITSDNFDYVGQRTTGARAGDFAIVGPHWSGSLPPGVQSVTPAPTPWILVLGRTLVDGPADVPAVRALQARYRLTPLSLWGRPGATAPERRDVLKPVPFSEDPLGPWKTLNAMLAENPPPEHHELLLRQLARIGVGPGQDVEIQPEAVRRSLARAAAVGTALLSKQFLSGDWATSINGWGYPPPQIGRFGDDFLERAADQSLAGIAANDPAEAVYLMNFDDADGHPLDGGRYELHFSGDSLPPVDACWSLTAYSAPDLNLVPNPAGRYSVGDRTAGLKPDSDGGLTIRLQADSPGLDLESSWLPCPAAGPWFVILRLYRPRPEVVTASWRCPGIVRTG